MAQVVIRSLNKKFDEVHAVKDVNLDIRDKEFMVFVGPSGCGKTTTLRMVAGLESITSGRILIDDKVINELPPMDRDIAMVFQNYALYPHMSVYDNMAFGLKMRKFDRADIAMTVVPGDVAVLRSKRRWPDLRRIASRGLFDRHDRGQRLVVDLDQIGTVLGCIARLGDDHRHRVAHEADNIGGQWQPRRRDDR